MHFFKISNLDGFSGGRVWDGVDRGHRQPVDVPEVEVGAGAGDDVSGQVVDVHSGHWARVPGQVLHISEPGQRMTLKNEDLFSFATVKPADVPNDGCAIS